MDSPLSRRPFAELEVGAHRVSILKDGAQAYPAMLEAIAGAREFVCLESYIFCDDGTGRRFAEALCARARAGVEVNVLYDGWGSEPSDELLAELREAGVRVVAFHPIRVDGPLGRVLARVYRRNHRKSLIVDRTLGFTGGLNLSDDYAAREDGGNGWRDTHVRLDGPAAAELLHLFLETWRRAGGAPIDAARYRLDGRRPDPAVRIIGSELRANKKRIRRAYVDAIKGARARIQLTNAYFLPTFPVMRALTLAARRGVRVQVILAGETDVKAVLLAARSVYGRLLRAGIEVYEWQGRVLHAKTAVVDGHWSTIGSSNLDALSLRVNLEVNAVIEDERFGAAMERLFEEDLPHCKEITLRDWRQRPLIDRFVSWFAFLFREWL